MICHMYKQNKAPFRIFIMIISWILKKKNGKNGNKNENPFLKSTLSPMIYQHLHGFFSPHLRHLVAPALPPCEVDISMRSKIWFQEPKANLMCWSFIFHWNIPWGPQTLELQWAASPGKAVNQNHNASPTPEYWMHVLGSLAYYTNLEFWHHRTSLGVTQKRSIFNHRSRKNFNLHHTWLCWFNSINCSNCATSQLSLSSWLGHEKGESEKEIKTTDWQIRLSVRSGILELVPSISFVPELLRFEHGHRSCPGWPP